MDKKLIKEIENRENFLTMFDEFENTIELDDSALINKYHLSDEQLKALYHCLTERQMLFDCLYNDYFKK